MKHSIKHLQGVTLIELIIVMVIMAILAAIAIPVYQKQVTKARRSDAVVALLNLGTRMERYFSEHHTYARASLKTLSVSKKSSEGCYNLSLSNLTATTFTVTATPTDLQGNGDIKCGALSINQLGQKSISGTGTLKECW